jgi:hypothetical protein
MALPCCPRTFLRYAATLYDDVGFHHRSELNSKIRPRYQTQYLLYQQV